MCGIIGLVTIDEINIDHVNNLSIIQNHRGPDETNHKIINIDKYNLVLSHQRLSIVDLKNGTQPMSDYDGIIEIIFNGEIYNHVELRRELINKGHIFRTNHSDTEVVINSYKEWGIDCFNKFNGMWAIAIVDKFNKKIILSRDRIGKKPLFYYHKSNQLIFSSELKVIKKYKNKLNVNSDSILEYLEYGYIHSPNTIYKEVKKLKPASYMVFDLNGNEIVHSEYKYWNFKPKSTYSSESDWNNKLKVLIEDSVSIRLNADVEVGTFLSGGVDSSLISAIAKKKDSSLTSYTIGFKNNKFDELSDSLFISKKLNIEHKHADMSVLDYKLWDEIISNLDEPFADASIFPTYAVSKLASKDLKVILSGDGGDEQFCGYPRYIDTKRIYEKYSKYNFIAKKITNIIPFFFKGYNFLSLVKNSDNMANLYNSILKDRIVNSLTTLKMETNNPYEGCNTINDILFNDLSLNMSDQILTKVDRMSMLNSLEVRSPLLDYRIIEHVFSAPLSFRYKLGDKKYALKKLAIDLGIPKEHIYKEKRGFNAPIDNWLKSMLKNDVYKAAELEFIDKNNYLKAVKLSFTGKKDYFQAIFRIVLLYKWLEKNE